MQLRKRRSLRSNRKPMGRGYVSEAPSNGKLQCIPEVEDNNMKDLSSSEKPKIKGKLIMNQTIYEEEKGE